MATYMGAAWIDVATSADTDTVLDALDDEDIEKAPQQVYARVVDTGAGRRVELNTDDTGYGYLPDLVVHVMRHTGVVARAFVVLDHDEYGAEHVVLAMRDGRVERVHHRFVYPRRFGRWPYRAGEPWRTDLPTVTPSKVDSLSGRIVDGSAARSALAALYAVPLGRVRAAARLARHAYQDLGVVGAPFEPWLNALGIAWAGERGESAGRVRNRPVWRAAFIRYARPELPGRWVVLDDAAFAAPVDLIACGVVRDLNGLAVVLHPLYVPKDGWQCSPRLRVTAPWPYFALPGHAEAYMRSLAQEIRTNVLPHLQAYGSLRGFHQFCAEQGTDSDDPRWLYLRAATDIVLEHFDQANATLAAASRAPGQSAEQWYPDTASPASRATLLENVAEQRRLHGLPQTDE